ncbi:unnamed protein product, partial [Scytosiphon promiscuus]
QQDAPHDHSLHRVQTHVSSPVSFSLSLSRSLSCAGGGARPVIMPVTQLPPQIPSRRFGTAAQRSTPVGYRRSASTTLDLPSLSSASPRSFRPKIARSQSFGIDSSHLVGDGLYYDRN